MIVADFRYSKKAVEDLVVSSIIRIFALQEPAKPLNNA